MHAPATPRVRGGPRWCVPRNPSVITACDVVVDVGGEYDHGRKRYDHHQRGFAEETDGVKLSSAGLIYRHYGRRVVERAVSDRALPLGDDLVDAAYSAFYTQFVRAIDAVDNGIEQWPTASGPPLYLQSTTLSVRIARMNGAWNQDYSPDAQYRRFVGAMEVMDREIDECLLRDVVTSWLPGRMAVREAMERAASSPVSTSDVVKYGKKLFPSVVVFSRFCPWRDHLHSLEVEAGTDPSNHTLYVVYPEDDRDVAKTRWRVQAVNIGPGSFKCRLPFPEAWRGLSGEALSLVTGIPGCVFTHADGFIAGNDTREGAIAMAVVSRERSAQRLPSP